VEDFALVDLDFFPASLSSSSDIGSDFRLTATLDFDGFFLTGDSLSLLRAFFFFATYKSIANTDIYIYIYISQRKWFPVGKIAEKAVCRSTFWDCHCIFLRLFFCDFFHPYRTFFLWRFLWRRFLLNFTVIVTEFLNRYLKIFKRMIFFAF